MFIFAPPLRFPHSMRTRIRNTFAPFVGFRSAMCIKICHFLTKINSKLGLAPYQKIFRVFPDPFSTPNLKMKLYPWVHRAAKILWSTPMIQRSKFFQSISSQTLFSLLMSLFLADHATCSQLSYHGCTKQELCVIARPKRERDVTCHQTHGTTGSAHANSIAYQISDRLWRCMHYIEERQSISVIGHCAMMSGSRATSHPSLSNALAPAHGRPPARPRDGIT